MNSENSELEQQTPLSGPVSVISYKGRGGNKERKDQLCSYNRQTDTLGDIGIPYQAQPSSGLVCPETGLIDSHFINSHKLIVISTSTSNVIRVSQ